MIFQSHRAFLKDGFIENTCREIGALLTRMTAILLPELQFRMFSQRQAPRRSNRRDCYVKFLGDPVVPSIDLSLHAFVITDPVFWKAISMSPGEEEQGRSASSSDLFDKSPRRGVHGVGAGLLH